MEIVFLAAFLAGLAVVAVSYSLLLAGRARKRSLTFVAGVLGLATIGALAALGIDLVEDFVDTAWAALAAGGLAAATVAVLALAELAGTRERMRSQDDLLRTGEQHIRDTLDAHARKRVEELERMLARERSNATHILAQQERKQAVERRDAVARQADRARAELAKSVEQVQERLEQRLAAWAADLDRGQRALEARLTELAQRQGEAIKAYEARLAADSDYLHTVTEEQQAALAKLRTELQQVGREILEEGRAEIEAHADERRRALAAISTRLRDQERELRDHVEHEESEAVARITSSFTEIERRQQENLRRSLDRAAGRLSEDAERRFDVQIRQSREKSAQRLSNELDKQMEQFARQAEKEISDRISEAAQEAAGRLERRIGDISRAAEAQHEVAAERLRQVTDRLGEAVQQAEGRIAAFERQVETELASRLEQLERSLRAAEIEPTRRVG